MNAQHARNVLAALAAVTALAWTASGGLSQGSLKGKVLPIVSTSDVIGYVAPCG